MSGGIDHAAEAASLIEHAYSDDPVVLDGIKAVAHATLALVEQQRIANLIAFVAHAAAAVGDDATPEAVAYLSGITAQIREALGL